MINYLCSKFGDCIFSRVGSIVQTNIIHTDTRTDADEPFTPATLVGVSNKLPQTHAFISLCLIAKRTARQRRLIVTVAEANNSSK